ncbi:MAG: ApbE superfamily uncharacterized protein (UPF0280 family) [Paracoccaceae bacterium]|jgi:ApbE superfamily uncharacterized protein (UPF0280 family)
MGAQASFLPDGRRLHLHHGPIDLIIGATGAGREAAFKAAAARFDTVLEELVVELEMLRQSVADPNPFQGEIARLMHAAVAPLSEVFITPMAAVAGSVSDTILAALRTAGGLQTAYVNNGGDVAMWLAPGTQMTAAIAAGLPDRVTLTPDMGIGGIATSGWRGRSLSFGIADGVTVLARTAVAADAAATLIANAVDLPGNAKIKRLPACDLAPDSDLGMRLITVDVAPLTASEIAQALKNGAIYARLIQNRGLIHAALLTLNDQRQIVGTPDFFSPTPKELHHA